MPENLTPQDQWETQFEVPLPGEYRNIGPLRTLFQRLLNRTERLKGRIGDILGLPWDAAPPTTIAQLHDRMTLLETSVGGYGENSNGQYVRFPNGVQICWALHDPESFGSMQENTLTSDYKYRLKTWVYPAAFAAAPVVIAGGDLYATPTGADEVIKAYGVSATACTLEAGRYSTPYTIDVVEFYTIAIGRWQ